MPQLRTIVLGLTLAAAASLAGCGDEGGGGPKASIVPGWDLSSLPPADPVRVIEGDQGLWILVLQEGTGDPVPAEQPMYLRYTLRLMNGRVLESGAIPALVRGQSASGWIPGFLKGLADIRMMERRRLLVPAALGYGVNGKAPTIPPNSRLVFDVQPVQLVKEELVEGDGPAAKVGGKVTVHYEGRLADGTIFDSSRASRTGEPVTFPLRPGALIEGWILGIPGMRVGGKRKLWIPHHLAYDDEPPPGIPVNADLSFVVELLEVE